MSIRQRATGPRAQDAPKQASVAGDRSKPSKVTGYFLFSLKTQTFDLDTHDLVNTHRVHCDLCYSSLNLVLLDGFSN